jgi:hypothetical protein
MKECFEEDLLITVRKLNDYHFQMIFFKLRIEKDAQHCCFHNLPFENYRLLVLSNPFLHNYAN